MLNGLSVSTNQTDGWAVWLAKILVGPFSGH